MPTPISRARARRDFAALRGAEIFSSGKWNGLEFTEADLDAIVASFNELAQAGRVPLKFGHNDEQAITDGQPSIGWVDRVWRDGGKLLADFSNIPQVVYQSIKDKLYNFVSVELLQDAERNGASFPWVLSAVALLGADPPAVSNLSDLSRLVMSRRAALQFSRAGTFNLNGELNDMADDKLEATLAELAELKARVAKFSDENKAIAAERDKLIEDGKREKATAIKSSTEQKFEAAIAAKRLLPSARERFFKWTFPKDNEAIIAFDATEADRYIKENEVMQPTAHSATFRREDEEGKPADTKLVQRVRIFMSENHGVDYKDAMVAVLRDDPALAEEYRNLPETLSKGV